jgi:zinc/manganese transport system substrate-binding protein
VKKSAMNRTAAALTFLLAGALPALAADKPISIVAAENFYGEAAQAVGGNRVSVTNVIEQPGTDPHDYEPTAAVARAVADADIVILNGAGYDPWMERLAESSRNDGRTVIDVAALLGRKPGDNPHVWYDPKAIPALVRAVGAALAKVAPADGTAFRTAGDSYLQSLAPIEARIGALRARFAGTPVTATEPVFGYMADALGLTMLNGDFQTAVMNETEPSAKSVAAMESDLKGARVKVLFYNAQVEDPLTQQLSEIAKASGVAVVGVTETKPDGKTFAEWMLDAINATGRALGAPAT